MDKVHVNSFVKRQTSESEFTHYVAPADCDVWESLQVNVERLLRQGNVKPGYRDGVILVHMNPQFFMSGVVQLQEGDELKGSFEARREGEEPRKSVRAIGGRKTPARNAYAVLYASTVLAEGGDNELPAEDGNWEVISLNASPVEGEMPISPEVLMHNHFGSDGGTDTHLSDSEFVAMLRESFNFWKDKTMVE